jgi:hypothetical protein
VFKSRSDLIARVVDLISIASEKEDQLTRHIARIPLPKYLNSSNIFVVLEMLSKASHVIEIEPEFG